ncbi:MAG: translocation/assembly module TamB domain-containing protein [Williamsia sp.]|nr:translocation/assembly module TamB domain-containing protein [Williamsia sp.]
MTKETKPPVKKSLFKRILRILLTIFISIFLLLVLVLVLIQTPPVQNFILKRAQSYLENKLQTRVELGRIYIGFPKNLVLEDVYIEDKQKDTLLLAQRLKVDVSMLKLLHSQLEINDLRLNGLTAKVKRQLPDTTFNFQFIIDAFASKEQKPTDPADTGSFKIDIKYVQLDKIRLVYNDVITGNDVDVKFQHFETDIKKFDLDKQRFDVPVTKLSGLRGKIYQIKPLKPGDPMATDVAQAQEPIAMQLNFKKLELSDINLDYRNDQSAMYANLSLGELGLNIKGIDLQNRLINLDQLQLDNTTAGIRFGKKATVELVQKEVAETAQSQAQAGWRVNVDAIRINNNNLQYDDDNVPRVKAGMDYSHIKAADLTLHLDDLRYSTDSISGTITRGELKEQSGFQLNKWQTRFLYANQEAFLKDLILETPGTRISRSVVLHYPSIEALKTNPNALQMDVDLQNSTIQYKDILLFVPTLRSQPAFANENQVINVTARLKGSMDRLNVPAFQVRAFRDTRINISGSLASVADPKKIGANLQITEFNTSKRDLLLLAPKGSIPSNITLPERINLKGSITGGMNNMNPDLVLNTDLGSIRIKGSIQNPTDSIRCRYNVAVQTNNLNLGKLLQQPGVIGPLSARFTAKGTSYAMKTINANIDGIINSVVYNKYNYRNVRLTAGMANQQVTVHTGMQDPNLHFMLDASADMRSKYPAVSLTANIDSVKTLPLHLTTQSIVYRGNITGSFPVTDPDNLQGNLFVTNSLLAMEAQRLEVDTIALEAGQNERGQFLSASADPLNMRLEGRYKLTQLGDIFLQAIQPYFEVMPPGQAKPVDPYDFRVTGSLVNKPLLTAFLPDLQRLEPVNMNGHFSTDSGWSFSLSSPEVLYGTNKVTNLLVQAGTNQGKLGVKATVQQLTSGKSIALYGTAIDASITENKIDFALNIKDKASKDKYRVHALFAQPSTGVYTFSIFPQELLLDSDPWTVTGDNLITIFPGNVTARNFVLSKNNQILSINSQSSEEDSPLEVNFSNFKLATLANFVQSDSLLVDGTLNGKAVASDLMKQPTFTSDLTISDVSVKNDTVGTVNIKVNNTVANKYAADVKVTGRGNDIQLTGDYNMLPGDSSNFDMKLDIRQVLLSTLEGASLGAIRNASGALTGNFAFTGTVAKPSINGNLNFNKTGFNLTMLNSYFRIDDESIKVDDEGVHFDTYTIRDSTGNTAVLDGTVFTKTMTDYVFDLTFQANNFRALNTTRKDNKVYYGQLYFNSDLRIKGTQVKPVVDGSLTVNNQTRLTVVLPQAEPGVQAREGIVEFVDMDAVPNDSLFMAKYDSLNKSEMMGLDITVNLTIDKNAEFNVIVDEGNGDFLRVKGEATLSAGIDPSGKITMTGAYELSEGAYELSFNVLHRRFDIQKGSRIVWTGEPTDATVDLTAVYLAKTAPYDLVQQSLTGGAGNVSPYLKQKLPFQVDLIMKGALMKPDLSFDIVLPENQNYNVGREVTDAVSNRLQALRQEPAEMNKQVFALLLLGRFITENPFASSGAAGGSTAESFARSSVSKLLTEQLNNLASDLIKGVDINFDVDSRTDDYTTGERSNRTDLNVALSKRLLNDRLTVTVGSNFQLEGAQGNSTTGAQQRSNNLAGNVAIDYKLSQDGRYMLRAYRRNEYEGVLYGYIIETGVGFIINVDYNKFKQIFLSQKQREAKRAVRQQRRKEEEEQEKKKAAEEEQRKKKEAESQGKISAADDRKKDIQTTNEKTND